MESNRLLKKRMTIMPPEKVTNVPSRSCCFYVLAAPGHTARVNQKARKVDTGQHTSGGLARIQTHAALFVRPHISLPGIWSCVFASSGTFLLKVSKNTLQKAEPGGRCLSLP